MSILSEIGTQIGTELKTIKTDLSNISTSNNETVGFHADGGADQDSDSKYTVKFGSARIDTHNGYDGNARYTCQVSGTYLVNYGWMLHRDSYNRHALYKNSSIAFTPQYAGTTIYTRVAFSGLIYLDIGDYIEVENNINNSSSEGSRHPSYDYFNAVRQGM